MFNSAGSVGQPSFAITESHTFLCACPPIRELVTTLLYNFVEGNKRRISREI